MTIRIESEDGQSAVLPDSFVYRYPLTIESLSLSSGSQWGGDIVEITGSGFDEGTLVFFGGRPGIGVQFSDPENLIAIVPSHEPGPVDVVVASATQSAIRELGFTYIPEPLNMRLDPPYGPASGSTIVELVGDNLNAVEGLRIDTNPAAPFEGTSDESSSLLFSLRSPRSSDSRRLLQQGLLGDRPIPSGFSFIGESALLEALKTFPDETEPGEAFDVVVVGLSDEADIEVFLGEVPLEVLSVEGNIVRVTTPDTPFGEYPLVVSQNEDASPPLQHWVLPRLEIGGIEPNTGSIDGGTLLEVAVSGCDIRPCELWVGALPASVTSATADTLVGSTPIGSPGWVPARVRRGLRTVVQEEGFEYSWGNDLFAFALSPNSGSIAGGTYVEVFGAGFDEETRIAVDGETVDTLYMSESHLAFYSPRSAVVHSVDVEAIGPQFSVSIPGGFTYYNPTLNLGGTWGGPIQNTVNISILNGFTGIPILDALVVLNSGSEPSSCFTDENGHCTFSDPDLDGPVDVSAYRAGFSASSLETFDAKNATLFLYPEVHPNPAHLDRKPR